MNTRVSDLLEDTRTRLERHGISEPGLKAELLLSEALSIPRLEIPHQHQHFAEPRVVETIHEQTERLVNGEPLQYILGHASFMGFEFKVDRRALIPRPETEILVTETLDRLSALSREQPSVADVGTGTGCIAISLWRHFPAGRYFASDISSPALALARENAEIHGALDAISWLEGPLLEPYGTGSLDVIVSNPPYITTSEIRDLPGEIRDYEPREALEGGPDGLAVVKKLAQSAPDALRENGYLLMEIGAAQSEAALALMRESGFTSVQVTPDLAGRPRVVSGEWKQ